MQVPRYTYLPLLIPEIRENFIDLALDEQGLEGIDESQWWFEEQVDETASFAQQGPCKWYVSFLKSLWVPTRHVLQ